MILHLVSFDMVIFPPMFCQIMFKEFNLIRCEAKVEAFKHCNLYKNIPELQQNALDLYEKLNEHCRTTGSTYIDKDKLVEKVRWEIGDDVQCEI